MYYADTGCFQAHALDVGLLGAMPRAPVNLLVKGGQLFSGYEGFSSVQRFPHCSQKISDLVWFADEPYSS